MNKNKQGIIVVVILTLILLSSIIMIVRFEAKIQKDNEKNITDSFCFECLSWMFTKKRRKYCEK